ncbi:type II secretion system minor pseudopilin GspI [Shewanella youngdeokensis]|uniref:Type II secretion system protein I n=1 Tax=Shewanella youngdeokensis TaxID=2999068 RepID=A0ABZ0JY18_9GAMM|nr:type II secretion system minor pseudopilin GspI [Shewanella sp. DAU334]
MNKQRGMTLLEVIVALAVFSIAAVSITKSLGELMANMPILEERTLAQWVADNQMVEARLEASTLSDVARKEGQEQLANKDWYWRREIVKTADDNFKMIRITVSDDERFKRVIAEVSSYVIKTDKTDQT